MIQEFPKWMYHPTEPAVIVQDPQQQDDLGSDWAESPAAFTEPAGIAQAAPPKGKR